MHVKRKHSWSTSSHQHSQVSGVAKCQQSAEGEGRTILTKDKCKEKEFIILINQNSLLSTVKTETCKTAQTSEDCKEHITARLHSRERKNEDRT